MRILLLFIFISLSSSSLYCAQWVAKEGLPYEIQTLVESFEMDYLTDEEKTELKSQLQALDSLMNNLDTNDQYFLAKSSIYRWILKSPPQTTPPSTFTLERFTSDTKSNNLSPFAKWLLLALKSDAIDILSNPNYRDYLRIRNNKKIPYQFVSIRKRIQLLSPWAYLFYRNPGEQVNLQLTRYQFSLLRDVVAQYKLFYHFKGKQIPAPDTKRLTLFSFQQQDSNKAQSIDKSLNDLERIIEKHRKSGLPVPVNEWNISKNDDWTPGDIEANPVNPILNYKVPKKLPKPVDEWSE